MTLVRDLKTDNAKRLKIAISINTAWNVLNFRSGLIRELTALGYQVLVIAPRDDHVAKLEELGCRFVDLPMDNKGTNPVTDLALFLRYRKILARERPDVFLGYTIKPNVYGSLAAHSLGISVINNVSGLGTAFIRDNWLTKIVRILYKTAFSRSKKVYFQNPDDRNLFVENAIARPEITDLLPGSGINLEQFRYEPMPSTNEAIRFLLIARLLYDKGVGEFVEAARILKKDRQNLSFSLLGFLDIENRTAVSRNDVDRWVADGIVEYIPAVNDVRGHIAAADCIVLPSYREGTPRTLLEGASMGRPLIATDVPGCRETVDDGINGFLCEVRNAEDLAAKMRQFADMPISRRAEMGKAGREKMERQFDEKIVIKSYLDAIKAALG